MSLRYRHETRPPPARRRHPPQRFTVAGIGELLWDVFPEGKKLGGAPVNFAHHCRQMGADAFPVSAIGADALGTEILKALSERNLSGRYVAIDATRPTGTVRVALHYVESNPEAPVIGSDTKESLLVQELRGFPALDRLAPLLQVGVNSAERLQVAGRPALWVRGSWNGRGGWLPAGTGGLVIVEDGDILVLLWGAYDREENLRIAQSLFD